MNLSKAVLEIEREALTETVDWEKQIGQNMEEGRNKWEEKVIPRKT